MSKKIMVLYYYLLYKYFYNFSSRKKLVRWQERKIKKNLKYLKKHSPYYKKIFQSNGSLDLNQLPIMDKKTMMENFNEVNCVNIKLEEAMKIALNAESCRDFSLKVDSITVGLSSGTSGNRGIFIANVKEQNLWAGAVLAKTSPKSIFSKQKIAFFMRANSNLYNTLSSKSISFRFFDILEDIGKHIDVLSEFKPDLLVGAPSVLRILAEAKKNYKLDINPIKIISIAEVLEKIDKEYIENHFNQKIYQVYQCTEGFLGYTCEHGTVHINEDIVHIEKEYIDDNRFYPIITDFRRTSQPIVRYRLNDVLKEKEDICKCGSAFIAIDKIEGREDDIFYFKSMLSNKLERIFPDFIRNALISSSHDIDEYRVIQEDFNKIIIQLKIKAECNKKDIYRGVKDSIVELLESKNCVLPKLIFEEYKSQDKSKKLVRVKRKMKVFEK